MSGEHVIEARGLSKRFKLYDRPRDRFIEWITFGARTKHESFWALRDVDVQLKRGEKLGIIGANGSGKSTLLKLLAGSLTPTTGTCEVAGRAFALLELSTGFNRDLTGRENIAFVGMMLGLDREYVECRRERIIEFADIGEFIDRPVRIYSSGMFVRLAFSLFAYLEPDLLMIDEAFAVGDAEFKEKSYKLMQSMVRAEGRSVIFVSHSMVTIEGVCDRVMWLEQGESKMEGEPKDVIKAYRGFVKGRKQERLAREKVERKEAAHSPSLAGRDGLDGASRDDGTVETSGASPTPQPPSSREEASLRRIPMPAREKQLAFDGAASDDVTIEAVWLEDKDRHPLGRIGAHRKFAIGCAARFARDAQPVFGIRVIGADGAAVTAGDTTVPGAVVPAATKGEAQAIRWPIARGLSPGSYEVVCWCKADESAAARAEARAPLHIDGPPRVDAALNLVMRPTIGRADDDR